MIFLIRFNNSKDADDTTPIKQPALCCSKTNEDMRIYFLFFKLYCHSSYFTNSCPLSSSISIKVVSYCGLWCVCGFTVVCGVSVVTLWSAASCTSGKVSNTWLKYCHFILRHQHHMVVEKTLFKHLCLNDSFYSSLQTICKKQKQTKKDNCHTKHGKKMPGDCKMFPNDWLSLRCCEHV